jgi:hypothetical protein
VDLGLSLADAQALGLASEPVTYKQSADPKEDLRRHGATQEECAFLVGERRRRYDTDGDYWTGQRIELNAMTSDQFVAWLEQRLEAHGVTKVIPDDVALANAYRNAAVTLATNRRIAELQAEMPGEPAVPDDLYQRLADLLAQHPTWPWDQALTSLVEEDRHE